MAGNVITTLMIMCAFAVRDFLVKTAKMVHFFCNIVRVFHATFNNISAISWRLVLLVEEIGVPGESY
jgi:hypothetical protein